MNLSQTKYNEDKYITNSVSDESGTSTCLVSRNLSSLSRYKLLKYELMIRYLSIIQPME